MKNYRRFLALALSLVMVLALTACGGRGSLAEDAQPSAPASSDSAASENTPAGDPIVIKIAHTDSGSRSTNVAAEEFKAFIEAETDGRVVVECYPDGQLGDDDDLLKAVQLGTVQVYIGGETVVSSLVGDKVGFTNLPYLYDSFDHFCEANFENGGLELYNELLEGSGFVCLDFEYDGFRNLITSGKAIRSLSDLSGKKIRTANTELYLATYDALDGNPTPMAFGEVYTGLTQGTIDGVDHCLGVMADQKYYEPCDYLTLTNHMCIPLVVVSSTAFVDSLPEDIRPIFEEGIAQMAAKQRELEYAKEQECIQIMADAGVEVIEFTEEQLQEFQAVTAPIYDQWREVLGSDVMDRVLEIVGK